MDDPRIAEYNLEERVSKPFLNFPRLLYHDTCNFQLELFSERIEEFLSYYSQGRRHIMFTMGDDFDYQNAHENFKNIDKLIYHMNERTDYNVFYSTPSCYAYALYQDGDGALGQEWQTKTDDFFPYCDENGRDKKLCRFSS